MAGYSTINAQFRPMSYQEMIAPVAAADTEHKAVEEQEAQLQTLASQWKEKLANLGPNSQARKLYEGYMDEINKQSELLSSQGLTPGARKSLAGLKARYSSDIVPIEEAYKKTQTNQQLIQQMKAKDSSYITDNNLTIDDYLKNPNATFNGLSLNEVEENAGRAFAEVAKKALTNGTFKKTLGGQYWERAVKNGYAEKVLHQLQSNPDDVRVPQELRDLYKNSITDYMSRGNWGESGKKSIINAINKASFRALESYEKPEMLSNKQWEYDMAEKKAKEAALGAEATPWEYSGNDLQIANKSQMNEFNKQIEFIKELQKQKDLKTWMKQPSWGQAMDKPMTGTDFYQAGLGAPVDPYKGLSRNMTWEKMVKQYGTKNPTQMLQKINNQIEESSKLYRNSTLKLNDYSVINPFLQQQLFRGKNEKDVEQLVKPLGDAVKVKTFKDAAEVFSPESVPGYSAYNNKTTMWSPKLGTYEVSKDMLHNIPITIHYNNGTSQTMTADNYLEKVVQPLYKSNDPNQDAALDVYYRALSVYGRTGQPAPTKSSKEMNLEM